MCEVVRKYGDECESMDKIQERMDIIRNALYVNTPLKTTANLVGLFAEEVQNLISAMMDKKRQ